MTPMFVVLPDCPDSPTDTPRNRLTSAFEVAMFCEDPPDRYFAYMGRKGDTVTTWMGDVLGTIVSRGREWHSNLGDRRVPFRMRGVNGRTYSGVEYLDAGDYVRLRLVKGGSR